jgi:glycosyltransferase involved in cell wall biosynthesis
VTRRVVWILNHYVAEAARDGRTSRHEQFARALGQHGWHCVLIGASTVHPSGEQTFSLLRAREHRREETHEVLRLRGVRYRGPVGRILDMLLVTLIALAPGTFRGLPRPDVVVGSSFHPLAAWTAARLARRLGARFVFEPRDLWPETLVAFTELSERSLVVCVLRAIETDVVRRADAIVSPLAGAGDYYATRGRRLPFSWVSNGTEPWAEAEVEDRSEPGHREQFVVTYLGSVGRANALDAVVDAVAHPTVAALPTRVVLRIVGDGPALEGLRRRAAAGPAADRIEFLGRRSQRAARAIGRSSDCLVVNMADLPLYRWGVSFNKLFEYARIGRPVVLGVAGPVPVFDGSNAVLARADDTSALAAGIVRMVEMGPRMRDTLARLASERARRAFTYPVLTARFAAALDRACPDRPDVPLPHPPTSKENTS